MSNKYDRFGFDRFGFNKDGFDRMGYNREGFDRQGFNRNGYNKQGINKLTGLDREGYDSAGYNKEGFNRDGFNRLGYDQEGYDRDGYDRDGYDRDGFSSDGFDRYGYDRDGYSWAGFNRSGYDRNGFNRLGYDRDGYDRNGYDKYGYDRDGFDESGFDADGYDRDGYNKAGFDKDGYNRDGYNRKGFDRKGYDREGFDKYGYDHDGYDRLGFNTDGIDREGYGRDGFNVDGFDREGYDRQGFDKKGYDRDGFDKEGYDREGFNAKGYNADGFDRQGFDVFGFNNSGLNKNGYDVYGLSEDGYNILGYNEDGFDKEGFSVDGFTKDSFDDEGFHIYTGFNLKGFDREGFNINGIDTEGYDREGYHFITGLDRTGFDKDGFSSYGLDKDGYNRKGFNSEGYDREGYKADGFNKEGYNRNGFNRDGYDKRGYDINGLDINGNLDPSIQKNVDVVDEDPLEDKLEAQYFRKCQHIINNEYRNQVEKEERKDSQPIARRYIDRWGFVQYDVRYPDEASINARINARVDSVSSSPYFCHVDYKYNPELYIGKVAVHGWITDWADKQASYYYQYSMYVGNEDAGLNLVRDIYIEDRKYKGYKDIYNKNAKAKGYAKVADSHLNQIILANQKNKKIHDIIESIQQNQYTIITSDKEKPCVVLGCAGSGKTMILMHKIRYMKYNYRDLDMNQVIVISPTDILGRESRELSALLQVDRIKQYSMTTFYQDCCFELLRRLQIPFEHIRIENKIQDSRGIYRQTKISSAKAQVSRLLNSIASKGDYYTGQKSRIDNYINNHISLSGLKKKTVDKMYQLYKSSVADIQKAGKKDVNRLITQITHAISNKETIEDTKDFIEFIYNNGLFSKEENSKPIKAIDFTKVFPNTAQVIRRMDYGEFLRIRYLKDFKPESLAELLQIIQLFMKEKMDLSESRILLYELSVITEKLAVDYIHYAEKTLQRMDTLEKKKEILQYLLDNDMVVEKNLEQTDLRYDTAFNNMVRLFDQTEEKLSEKGYTPFTYFGEYDKIINRRERLERQVSEPQGNSYLFYAILSVLEVDDNYKMDINMNQTQIFYMANILCRYTGSLDRDKKYVFIDEFQEFAPSEIELISKIYPHAIINLFGDLAQCINFKGIRNLQDIPSFLLKEKPYRINENYRNARQITENINVSFKMNMLPVGLDGVFEIVSRFPHLEVQEDDRVAIIVADDRNNPLYFSYSEQYLNRINYFAETNEIKRGSYNVLPVRAVKGLEFEKVVVLAQGMTRNELYVACTRAISELYVVSYTKDISKIYDTSNMYHLI